MKRIISRLPAINLLLIAIVITIYEKIGFNGTLFCVLCIALSAISGVALILDIITSFPKGIYANMKKKNKHLVIIAFIISIIFIVIAFSILQNGN